MRAAVRSAPSVVSTGIGLAVTMGDYASEPLAIGLFAFSGLYAVVAAGTSEWGTEHIPFFRRWTRPRKPAALRKEAERIADRIRRCDPRQSMQRPIARPSPLGLDVTLTRLLERGDEKPLRFPRRVVVWDTRLRDRLQRVLEGIAEVDPTLRDKTIEHYLTNHPTPSECENIAIRLLHLSNPLPRW